MASAAALAVAAPAKINLFLHVLGRRADGYHRLDSLIAFAAVGDRVEVAPATDRTLAIEGPFAPGLSSGDDNLVLRAARALAATAGGRVPGAAIRLTKNLPVASGIGGGSSDAAATLKALDTFWRLGLGGPELVRLGLTLGADVPVCLFGRTFQGKTLVIKYGGAAMEQADLKEQFAKDVLLLRLVGIRPVIVHGGGPQIGALMKRLGKEPRFVGGMRVTDEETVQIVEMVLVGKINKEIVGLINLHGGRAVGLSGKDASLLRARKRLHRLPDGTSVDIGLVGEVEAVNPEPIRLLEENGFIPVIAPVGVGESGETYNINADLVAGDVAAALFAEKLIHLTDVTGINGEDGRLVSTLTKRDAERLIKAGVIDGGMLPKVESSLRALTGGAQKAHIIDGRVPHAILLEVLTKEGIGTEIVL